MEARPHRLHDKDAFFLRSRGDFLSFLRGNDKSFLAEDVFTRWYSVEVILLVETVRCANIDDVKVGVCVDFGVASVDG